MRQLIPSVLVVLALACAAQAAVTATVVEVAISAAAVTNDPTLAGARCYDLTVSSDGDLIGCQLTVTDGAVYNHFLGSDAPPNAALFGTFPAVEFDSYVDMPTTPPTILAGTLASGTTIDYGDLVDNGAQAGVVVARITFLDPGLGWGDLTVTENVGGQPVQTSFRPMSIPEPATMSLLGLGGLAVLRRRKWR